MEEIKRLIRTIYPSPKRIGPGLRMYVEEEGNQAQLKALHRRRKNRLTDRVIARRLKKGKLLG